MNRRDGIGLRVACWRDVAGMTQQELADRIGLSQPYVSQIESGRRAVEKRSTVIALATALGVSIDDLIGRPPSPRSATELAAYRITDAIRQALDEPDNPIQARPIKALAPLADEVRALQMACDYATLARVLPGLIAETRSVYHQAPSDRERDDALAVLVRACVTGAFVLRTLGRIDLSTRLAERAALAAAKLGEPVHQAAADFCTAQIALAVGSRGRALRVASQGADAMQADYGDEARRTWCGMLHLHAALAAASLGRSDEAHARLDEAEGLAAHVTGDPWRMEFSPVNVAIWRVGVALENGEADRAPELARRVDMSKVRSKNRRARLYIDAGRGFYVAGRSPDAVRSFMEAAAIAVAEVTRPEVREIVGQMVRDARRAAVGHEDLRSLALMAGIDPLDPPESDSH